MYDTFDPSSYPGHDDHMYEGPEILLNTANGETTVDKRINVHYPLLGTTSSNLVLPNGVSTCSEGKRVMVDGFMKLWMPGYRRLLIFPDRKYVIIPRLFNRMAYFDDKTAKH